MQRVARLRLSLDLDSSLTLPAALNSACELLGVAPHGALLVRSDQALAALAALQKHVARLHTELGVPQSLSTRAAVAQANKLLGLSPAGPLPVQAKALAAALGTSLD